MVEQFDAETASDAVEHRGIDSTEITSTEITSAEVVGVDDAQQDDAPPPKPKRGRRAKRDDAGEGEGAEPTKPRKRGKGRAEASPADEPIVPTTDGDADEIAEEARIDAFVAEAAAEIAEQIIVEAATDAEGDRPADIAVDIAPTAPEWPVAVSTTSLLFVAPPRSALPIRHDAPTRESSPFDDRDDDRGPGAAPASATTRRSRSRRRGGADGADDVQQPAQPQQQRTAAPRQQSRPEPITEPARVKGSTRLEAKKQRRREGRDGGRRRTVVTESEFLARREAVDRAMIVRSKHDRIQIAVLEDNVLVEHYVARSQESSLIGNVYLGRVQNVLPSMEAAFVDIGRGRNAVLYSGEVDWEAAQATADAEGRGQQARRIELALKPGDRVLVQVTKDPVGHKGARLTSQISLPGRYLVYVPNGSMSGISRKLPDTERARLKRILKEVLPAEAGVIVRTAAEGATEEQLTLDVTRLANQWTNIAARIESAQAPTLLHAEPDLLVKIVRDVFNEDFQRMIIEGGEARETISAYLAGVAPDLLDRVEAYEGIDSFAEFRVSEQIEKALDRKVWLPSGGSLVIDRTEAMTVVDVNTGKFVGAGGNLEETVTKNNIEAAEEVVRQLRLRDIGGIIVIDFIDMVLEGNRDLVLRRLVECLSRDRTKHQVAEVTSLGLVQMTRKKIGLGLVESFSEPCEVCAGRGIIVHHEPVVKLRAPDGGSRRSRGGRGGAPAGNGNGNGGAAAHAHGVKNGMGQAATGAITEDVRNALARVAASTVHPHPHDDAASSDGAAPAARDGASETPVESAPIASAAPVTILDIPIEVPPTTPRAADPAAEQLLASALDALPAERTGSRRRRGGRRAGSGGVVTPPSGD
jgi:ribonuclease E